VSNVREQACLAGRQGFRRIENQGACLPTGRFTYVNAMC